MLWKSRCLILCDINKQEMVYLVITCGVTMGNVLCEQKEMRHNLNTFAIPISIRKYAAT